MKRREFIKTAAVLPLINWDMAPTVPQHRPTDLEEAIAAYHWPHARKGLGAQMLRLSRNLLSNHSYTIRSIMVHRIDEKKFPGAFTLWCNVIGKYSGLKEKGAIKKGSWTNDVVEELDKEGYIQSGLLGDDVEVWLTTVPNRLSCYCPTLEQTENGWFYNTINWSSVKIGGLMRKRDFDICCYKYGLPKRRSS